MDLIGLIEKGALMTSMYKLAAYFYSHSNISSSERTLYKMLCRHKEEWEKYDTGTNFTPSPPVIT